MCICAASFIGAAALELMGCRLKKITFSLGGLGLIIYNVCFELLKANGLSVPHYCNPISSIILSASIPLMLFCLNFFVRQIKLISRGLTLKQESSINKIQQTKVSESTISSKKGLKKSNYKLRWQNLTRFIKKQRNNSLLVINSEDNKT